MDIVRKQSANMPKRYCSMKDYTKKAFIHNQAKTIYDRLLGNFPARSDNTLHWCYICSVLWPACEETLKVDWITNKSPNGVGNSRPITVDYPRSNLRCTVTYSTQVYSSQQVSLHVIQSKEVIILEQRQPIIRPICWCLHGVMEALKTFIADCH